MELPKILIIGQSFNRKNGGGITISNLFKGWPKERLAVASSDNLYNDIDFSICDTYFQLGYNGKSHPFPFGLVLPKISCGLIDKNLANRPGEEASNRKSGLKKYHALVTNFLTKSGIYSFFYHIKLSPDFKEWLKEYNPDIIYSQLSTFELIKFTNEVQRLLQKPVAIHIMDDWPKKITDAGALSFYWRGKIKKEFNLLLSNTSLFMSISDAMSEEYKKRYNKDFKAFHNPIEIRDWQPYSKTDWTYSGTFKILYAGRIGKGIIESVFEIAEAVNSISLRGRDICFEIQTPDADRLTWIDQFNGSVKLISPLPYSELPKRFSSVDLLVLPEDFDAESIEFLKYSIQTKVAEYMISGTPILVYADKSTALSKYAIQNKWAYLVLEQNKDILIEALLLLMENEPLRKELAEQAKKVAIENEDAAIVRENFKNSFLTIKYGYGKF